jgi:transcription elongation GreA/GreB family factor
MTSTARDALDAEAARLAADLAAPAAHRGAPNEHEEPGDRLVRLPVRAAPARLEALRGVLAAARVTDEPGIVAIGRRVTLREADGATWDAAIVAPGEGDPERGWLSADAPLGAAILGRRAGDRPLVEAPGGAWAVEIARIE